MKNRIARGLLVWLCVGALTAASAQNVDEIMKSLAQISGLKALKPVPQERMTREDLRKFFDKRMRDTMKPEQVRREELVLKMMGLVPQSFNLSKSVVDLLSEQAAAFYDYQLGKMVMLEGSNGMLEELALVHELAHALADQHFKIEKFLRSVSEEDEATLARQAVMEGQAQWLMSEYMARRMGQSLLTSPALANMLSTASDPSGQFPVYDQAPLYLRESLVFPYAAGMQFQQAVTAKLGQPGFAAVFEHPPVNSREVLHPDVYLNLVKEPPAKIEPPEIARGREWKMISEGVVGEFDHQVLLKLYAKDAMPLAAEWRAGQFRLYEQRKTKKVALSYATRWSNADAARRYMDAYRRVLAGKWTDLRVDSESGDTVVGFGGGARFELKLSGDTVVSQEGLPEGTLKQ